MGGLLNLPPEVIEKILSCCTRIDLLQLRLVCKQIKSCVDSVPRLRTYLKDIEITLNFTTAPAITKTLHCLPFSNFFIDLSPKPSILSHYSSHRYKDTPAFYEDKYLQTFLDKFALNIQKLRVSTMFQCVTDSELKFYLSLENLAEIEIDDMRIPAPIWSTRNIQEPQPRFAFPANKDLKVLLVSKQVDSVPYLVDWMKACPCLQKIRLPLSFPDLGIGNDPFGFGRMYATGVSYIVNVRDRNPLTKLQNLDFNNCTISMTNYTNEEIEDFQQVVLSKNLRFENVPASLALSVWNDQRLSREFKVQFLERISSFTGMSELMKNGYFKNLKYLYINCKESSHFVDVNEWSTDLGFVQLPELGRIRAVISNVLRHQENVQDFLECIFRPSEPRMSVTDLSVDFQTDALLIQANTALKLTAEYFDLAFPNLTRLELKSDQYTRREWCRVMLAISKKSFLQDLSLSTPSGIPEIAFYGPNTPYSAIFLQLQCLRKLRLDSSQGSRTFLPNHFETMGDGMLSMISRLGLTDLEISGGGWENISNDAILELAEGNFALSVQRVRLEALERAELQARERSWNLKIIAKLAHANRICKGLTTRPLDP